MNRNKNYWQDFYKNSNSELSDISDNSKFAEFTLEYLKDKKDANSLLDVGCGTGRDTKYFIENGILAQGIDTSCDDSVDYLKKGDALYISKQYDVYYLRFFLHSLEEKDMDIVMKNIYNSMSDTGLVFIETRSSKGITNEPRSETNFRSSIGSEHFRMLYSLKYLDNKFSKFYNVLFSAEERGLAPFKNEDPYIIRMILGKKA